MKNFILITYMTSTIVLIGLSVSKPLFDKKNEKKISMSVVKTKIEKAIDKGVLSDKKALFYHKNPNGN
jgi:hypothetical protein